MKILGIHHGHDSGAAVICDGTTVADITEERFSRQKHDGSFPLRSIQYCLAEAGVSSDELDCVALPHNSFPQAHYSVFEIKHPHSALAFNCGAVIPACVLPQAGLPRLALPLYIPKIRVAPGCRFFFSGHHAAHAAGAYYGYNKGPEPVLIATLDGAGDFSAGIWKGEGGKLSLLTQHGFSGSLGWFYSNVTEALGWRHGGDEWKVMGLAPYGRPVPGALAGFHPEYANGQLVRKHHYGRFQFWPDHGSDHYHGRDAARIAELAEKIGRENLAAEAQRVVEEQTINFILPWLEKEGISTLLCSGGFFLNVKVNQHLWYTGKIERQWIYPNPGDAGLARGAALLAHATMCPEIACNPVRQFSLGPGFGADEIRRTLKERGIVFREVENQARACVPHLLKNRSVAWFQGRAESGPRALGNRSILMDPRHASNKDLLNARVKFREPFRPFCPSVLAEHAGEYLLNARDESFMTTSFLVKEEFRPKMAAVVHVDGTARPQIVRQAACPLFHELIDRFGCESGVYALLNTSLNIKGEPIVTTPREAIRTFFDTGIDVLAMGPFLVEKPHCAPEIS